MLISISEYKNIIIYWYPVLMFYMNTDQCTRCKISFIFYNIKLIMLNPLKLAQFYVWFVVIDIPFSMFSCLNCYEMPLSLPSMHEFESKFGSLNSIQYIELNNALHYKLSCWCIKWKILPYPFNQTKIAIHGVKTCYHYLF